MNSTTHPNYVRRRHSQLDQKYNLQVSAETDRRVHGIASLGLRAIEERLEELDHEWSVEDILKLHAATFLLKFGLCGSIVEKKYFWGIAAVGAFALEQKLQGWSPPFALIRKMGRRTRDEIELEREALLSYYVS